MLKLSHSAFIASQIISTQYLYQVKEEKPLLDVALASLFIASKTNECIRRVRDMVNLGHLLHFQIRSRRKSGLTSYNYTEMPYISDEYYEWRERITSTEMRILRALGFRVQLPVEPTSLLASYLQALGLSPDKETSQKALTWLNDSGASWAWARFSAVEVICGCVALAASDRSLPKNWHKVFDVKSLDEIKDELLKAKGINWNICILFDDKQEFAPKRPRS